MSIMSDSLSSSPPPSPKSQQDCSTIPYCDYPAEMIDAREDGWYRSERAYTRPPPWTVVPRGTDGDNR